jgi:hypothetical protein
MIVLKIIALALIAYGAYGMFKKYRNEVSGGTSWAGRPLRSKPTRLNVSMGGNAVVSYLYAEAGVALLALIGLFA